ncbi:MAG TPA: ABC transporter substrate-binding protein [Usitatibacter sp.]|nr:ABC transporter substrate-binding protein [Usitatibacter sp.]
MKRFLAAALAALILALPAVAQQKLLRVPFIVAETHFDPATVSDLYSHAVVNEILESPLTYDLLARPMKLKPQTAEAMPEMTDGGRTYTIRLKKAIYFADDPVFHGKKRELTAADYEFAFKRLLDPRLKSPNLWLIEGRILGIDAAIAKAKKDGKLDYDARIPGLEVVDRYTLRIRLEKPDYSFLYILAIATVGAQAREVVEHYGDDIGAHPVGTGPFRLAEWRRSSRIVLERNPNFREVYYDEEAPADDPVAQRLAREMKGKRLPQLDRVEIYVLEEPQPRWLAFLNKELDWINVPSEFKNMALPGEKLAPWLDKRGVKHFGDVDPDIVYMYFNMKDATVGGLAPEKVALRRALGLAYNIEEDVNLVRSGNAVTAQGILPPGVTGYDPAFTVGKRYDPAKAKALLDMFGYMDRDGDGFREMPDGSPLVFQYTTEPDASSRLFSELWKKNMSAIGVRLEIQVAKWAENRKKSKNGLLQSWFLSWGADYPDGENFFQLLYGPNCGSSNDGCFQLPEYDALYDKAVNLPPGPERTALWGQLTRIVAAYAPWLPTVHKRRNQLVQPWVLGWRKNFFLHEGYRYVDIDLERRARELQ